MQWLPWIHLADYIIPRDFSSELLSVPKRVGRMSVSRQDYKLQATNSPNQTNKKSPIPTHADPGEREEMDMLAMLVNHQQVQGQDITGP